MIGGKRSGGDKPDGIEESQEQAAAGNLVLDRERSCAEQEWDSTEGGWTSGHEGVSARAEETVRKEL